MFILSTMKVSEQILNAAGEIISTRNRIVSAEREKGVPKVVDLMNVYLKYVKSIIDEGGKLEREKGQLIVKGDQKKVIFSEITSDEMYEMEWNEIQDKPSFSSEELATQLTKSIEDLI